MFLWSSLLLLFANELPAQQGPSDNRPGSELSVYLMTMGPGDEVWERFGHNAIGIRDAASGTDVVYNWGLFSFDEPGFIVRFLRGRMRYWMGGFDAEATVAEYVARNRTVTIQELDLSPAQRLALRDFLRWNSLAENRYYDYHYFRDNCSTRVRDALDRILGGALRQASESVSTGRSYRFHALRLMAPDLPVAVGIDLGLGRPADRPISAWEEMFIPMELMARLRSVRVPDDSGRLVPLVTSERVVFTAQRPPERDSPPPLIALGLATGVAGGSLGWLLWRRARHGSAAARVAVRSLIAVWGFLAGAVGVLLVVLRTLTEHEFAYRNENIFFYNPLWLALVLLVVVPGGSAWRQRARDAVARGIVWLTAVGLLLQLVPYLRQDSLGVMLLAAPLNIVLANVIRQASNSGD
jgi:hypothetical protein